MRGDDEQSGHLFSYLSPEQRVPADHPLRTIRVMTDDALRRLSPRFDAIYATTGRPSIPPEHLLRALLLQVLYSVRSERMLMEQLEYNLLFRWFVGLAMDDAVWAPTTFTKNRDRLLEGDIARAFFEDVVAQARGRRLLSAEHFTVDGTLLEAWAGQKSFKRKDEPRDPPDDPGNPTVEFPWGTALESDASVDDRSRQPIVQEGQGARSQAGLSRRSADGESPRTGRRRVRRAGDRHRRTRRRDRVSSPACRAAGSPSAATKGTTPAASWTRCGNSTPRPTSRRRRTVARSMRARRGIRATRSANAPGNGLKRSSAG